ncbi:putative ABC transporter permease protein YqgH [Thalassobacillus devorans]|uniref:Phosphate transport system permease protein n=1 Tax=Thalassobacillus devorans TaxID=279813 RepID=A0ABQ1P9L7_9BACI|nr:phosphate ABC transporter permease subunit PstC [Thalassobacillus devorans]NIK29659.1 phosphate transport system permease protein [Thalassobacillus devorans]GGC91816.1 putative ABC transporter permease protein YqgH [Thalassobacillus devorans]
MSKAQNNEAVTHRLLKKNRSSAKRNERTGKIIVFTSAAIIIAATIAITLFLGYKGLKTFFVFDIDIWNFLTSTTWDGTSESGAFSFIFGSFAVTFLAALFAAPIGIGSAIFMTEIAKKWGQKVLQPVIEILVGIPSVVYGLIGVTVIVPLIRNHIGGLGFSLLAGMIVVGVMILPTITSISADAIKAIPIDIKDAAYGLGATRWQTIYKVIIPAALPSLMTAIVFGMARAFGEALAIQMVIGNVKGLPDSITDQAATLTSIITLDMPHTTYGSVHNSLLWSLGLILLVMSYVFIIIIRVVSSRRKI